jgi:CBS domain-containing protein
MKDLSHVGPLNDLGEHATDWLALPFYVSLALFVFSRVRRAPLTPTLYQREPNQLGARGQFSGTVLAATMPISCGVFGPCLAMGMGMGRAVGEYLRNTYPAGLAYFDQDLSYAIIPATYAITGAAAFSAGVTHTLSTAVIVLEMSGQLNLVAPIMVRVSRPQDRAGCRLFELTRTTAAPQVAVSISVAVSRMLSVNYYDKIATLRNLPFLPDLDARYVWPPPPRVCLFEHNIFDSIDTSHAHTTRFSVYEVTAGEIMETNVPFVLQHATPKEVASLLSKNKDANVFPVVNSKGKAYLLSLASQLAALMELTSVYSFFLQR